MKRIHCSVDNGAICPGRYLIQARDHLWAEGREWGKMDELWREFKRLSMLVWRIKR